MSAFIENYSVFCPLGHQVNNVFDQLISGKTAFSLHHFGKEKKTETVAAIPENMWQMLFAEMPKNKYSRFEKMCIYTVKKAIKNTKINPSDKDCIFVVSTTKGNIDALDSGNNGRNSLFHSAKLIAEYFNNPNRPMVVSNACISGVLALILAKDILEHKQFKHAIVIGADILSEFVVAGFQSFQALDEHACRPFDKNRKGLNLGEAAACIILSSDMGNLQPYVRLAGGGLSNDANHLSGPSRTGKELADAIKQALTEATIIPQDISMVSAHGTATRYNDEMEAKALALSNVNHAPLHSLKSQIGHTLGAAGIIETVFAIIAMQRSQVIPSLHFLETDVPVTINVCRKPYAVTLSNVLKTASGFGGCNAALVLKK